MSRVYNKSYYKTILSEGRLKTVSLKIWNEKGMPILSVVIQHSAQSLNSRGMKKERKKSQVGKKNHLIPICKQHHLILEKL